MFRVFKLRLRDHVVPKQLNVGGVPDDLVPASGRPCATFSGAGFVVRDAVHVEVGVRGFAPNPVPWRLKAPTYCY
jgi:hypothetical protein